MIAFLNPLGDVAGMEALAATGASALAVELVPRITRAQSMDALSSQATAAGYRAVLYAASTLPRFFPLLMTAAGTVKPARVLVLGAGVAGLQAIATARRLGAVVTGFDVRPAVKEQVESLGARFLELDLGAQDTETAGGYAKELDEDAHRREQELVANAVADSDVVITTALIPGRAAPELITGEAVAAMRAGSVIVDLAAEAGGNCTLTEPGQIVERHGVTIIGTLNLPGSMAQHASQLYAKNVQALIGLLAPEGELVLDMDDEIVRDALVTHDGLVVNARVAALAGRRAHEHRPDHRADRLRARGLRRLRGDLEGADDAPHAADERHERDPRHRHRRRDPGRRRLARRHALDGVRRDRGRLRHRQRGRRLPRHRPDAADVQAPADGAEGEVSRDDAIRLAYLVAAVLFILGLKFLSTPRTARRGNVVAAVGMLVAIVATLADERVVSLRLDRRRDGDRRAPSARSSAQR